MKIVRFVGREAGWWLLLLPRVVLRWPSLAGAVMAVGAVTWLAAVVWVLLIPAAGVVLLRVWFLAHRRSFDAAIGQPCRELSTYVKVRRQWPLLAQRVGLAVPHRGSRPIGSPGKNSTAAVVVPVMERLGWERHGVLVASVRLELGQRVEDVAQAADAIRQGVGAQLVRVASEGNGLVELRFFFDDPLAGVVDPELPEVTDLSGVQMGVTESGDRWLLRVGPHTLVAGSSGSGKASLVWSLAFGLAPAVNEGWVEIHGVDLKGGMELAMGRDLLTRYARTPAEAVVLLEEAADAMQDRAIRLAGVTRQHTPSVREPQVVVLIDELAALTAYVNDRDLKARAQAALALLCSQGRAVGYTVFACLQDPRKETIPVRGLFTQMVGLRLKDREETAMVLGEGMREAGVACHKIPSTLPGVGYVVPEGGGSPMRVRAARITDEHIRNVAAQFPARMVRPVIVAAEAEPAGRPSRRRRTAASDDVEAA